MAGHVDCFDGVQVDQIVAHNAQRVVHIAEVEGHTVLIKSHLRDCELQWHKALANNAWLHQQLALLTTEVQVQLTLSCRHKLCFRLRNCVCTVWKCDSKLLISYSTCCLGFQVFMQHQYMCMVSDKVQTVFMCVHHRSDFSSLDSDVHVLRFSISCSPGHSMPVVV